MLLLVCKYLLLVGATILDLKNGIIPNKLTYGAAMGGLLVHTAIAGREGLKGSLLGLATGGGIFLVLYVLRSARGGDVKLVAALGAIQGYPSVFSCVAYSLFSGGLLALCYLVYHRIFWKAVKSIGRFFLSAIIPGMKPDLPLMERTMPFAPALLLGALAADLWPL